MMLTGLSAFPLTPLAEDRIDEAAFAGLVERAAMAGVDSITALGSTGSYMYLDREERRRIVFLAVANAAQIPVVAGIGALRTSQVLALADDAQAAGASAVLLAPVTYQALTDDEAYSLFADVTAELSVPLVVYDNPGTTRVDLSDDLYASIAQLPHVASIKIPGIPADPLLAAARVQAIRARVPAAVSIGISGDASAATGLIAGCDAWYSVIGGLLPERALRITRAVRAGDDAAAMAESVSLQPLWALFDDYGGSYRVIAAIAEHLGLVAPDCLPRPVHGLDAVGRARVAHLVSTSGLNT